ncbi:uncharacterized protein HMPREF1541_09654 [Cyphellophora europaea CBS 101466]|uniref:Transcription factor domain-containing protein n=1 Tax=Cyphellophora europaea (strain CBS 101466) TaxID=1220924 RepID=W2SA41_CYPE1|nr:uncharacterized protein HMPREF1541_09654 [Cyphellophora europaea CBS 101466]ETN44779.1 hypothetical protein HMPREF1541_09654 [Cyphellophora europaea CBS 101466]
MGSVDARFIIEAMNAGADVLRLAIGRFQASGALAHLPLRFFLFFTHAGVFLLKAVVVVPLPASQKRAILHLIRGLISCMSRASMDPRHPAVRNSTALDGLLKRIYRDQEIQTPAITRPTSPGIGESAELNIRSELYTEPSKVHNNGFPAFLGTGESPFVPERPLQELAADMDAVFGPEQDCPDIHVPLNGEHNDNNSSTMPSSDVFASLFNYDDRDFWGGFTPVPFE